MTRAWPSRAGLAQRGIRVIAMSRFGYLRTPIPADASPAAQADAHACLLDVLRIAQAAVMGGSAGAPSATQMAIRHPERVSALVLLVPLAHKPQAVADSAPPLPPWAESMMMRLIGSDFLFWAGQHLARDWVIKSVLATPPEQVAAASPQERARVNVIDTVRAEARDRVVDGKTVSAPWQGRFWNYAERGGMRVPLNGEVPWMLPEGAKTYWRGTTTSLNYEFAK